MNDPLTVLAGTSDSPIGRRVELDVGPVAHGGHCVSRHEARVYFVRHALPGERVEAVVTSVGQGGRFLRADAVRILQASPHRRAAPCPYAGPGACGGCDWQHADPVYTRELKAAVIAEQFARLAGVSIDVPVEALPGDADGLRWRTRTEFAIDAHGHPGLRRHRSHEIVAVQDCLIAHERVRATGVFTRVWSEVDAVDAVIPSASDPVIVAVRPGATGGHIRERVETPGWSGEFGLRARGFWQVHPGAASTFVAHVLATLTPREGDHVLDLYAGVGLFARPLADAVGRAGRVTAVESDRRAVEDGIRSATGPTRPRFVHGRVERVLPGILAHGRRPDLVVLDPPRTGAGRGVMRTLLGARPRRIAYVACDPASLARDTGYALAGGYELTGVRAFDAFPMTHHVECIATFAPAKDPA